MFNGHAQPSTCSLSQATFRKASRRAGSSAFVQADTITGALLETITSILSCALPTAFGDITSSFQPSATSWLPVPRHAPNQAAAHCTRHPHSSDIVSLARVS
ncbi:hypothetical protein V2G26_016132 [Clonostachys chloroleuca]